MPSDLRLPIKVVVVRDEDYRRPESTGGQRKLFGEVTPEIRDLFVHQIEQVGSHFADVFRRAPTVPAVARIVLKEKALAKSHRPSGLLDSHTCPIIGVRNFGEILISVRPGGLRQLLERVAHDNTKVGLANLSTIERIEPYSLADAVGAGGIEALQGRARKGAALKFRLFRHQQSDLDDAVLKAFFEQARALRLPEPEEVHYATGLRIFRLRDVRPDHVEPIARFVGTQSLAGFPAYRVVRTVSTAVRPVSVADFPAPEPGRRYPVVGIVDTGTPPNDPVIGPWVVARHDYVPAGYTDYDHGSFVAGLAVHARRLNQDDPRFPDAPVKLVDVAAVPNNGAISEDQLLSILEEVVPQHPDVRVWNLSLATDEPCENHVFSELAVALDELQDRFGVTFVFAAGNFLQRPFRGWPPQDLGEADRICSPADSVRGLTVASLAHLDRPNSRVKREEPSPFSRRGPGPVFLPKPELSHYGGNCDATATYIQTGVLSFDGNGNVAENIGTSFASPMVAALTANVEAELAQPPSRNLVKALVVHSAVLNSPPIKSRDLKYRGFGVPRDVVGVLTCAPWAATLIFEPDLRTRLEFEKRNFPIPQCLRGPNNVVRGEFAMTLVYDPPIDPAFGAEYCRSNVEVSLGTYDPGADGKPKHERKIPPEPKDVNLLYEKHLIEHGFKWSPVKVYRRSMARGVHGDEWRLRVSVHHRSGFAPSDDQGIALVVTMLDPEKSAPVYDEVVRAMNRAGWATVDLQVRDRLRITT